MPLGPWWVLSPQFSPHFLLDVSTKSHWHPTPYGSHWTCHLSPLMPPPTLSLLTATPGAQAGSSGSLSPFLSPQHARTLALWFLWHVPGMVSCSHCTLLSQSSCHFMPWDGLPIGLTCFEPLCSQNKVQNSAWPTKPSISCSQPPFCPLCCCQSRTTPTPSTPATTPQRRPSHPPTLWNRLFHANTAPSAQMSFPSLHCSS